MRAHIIDGVNLPFHTPQRNLHSFEMNELAPSLRDFGVSTHEYEFISHDR
jgi:hypothetical protein